MKPETYIHVYMCICKNQVLRFAWLLIRGQQNILNGVHGQTRNMIYSKTKAKTEQTSFRFIS